MTPGAEQPAVVVGIDGSETALGAARWAAEYAAGHSLPPTLVHVIPRLDRHFTSLGHLTVDTEAVRGAVAPTLAAAAQSAHLLVVGRGSADHRALGGHALKVAHRATCPVLVWRPPVAKRTGKPLPLVVGVDESDASRRALGKAFDIARLLHAHLTVVRQHRRNCGTRHSNTAGRHPAPNTTKSRDLTAGLFGTDAVGLTAAARSSLSQARSSRFWFSRLYFR